MPRKDVVKALTRSNSLGENGLAPPQLVHLIHAWKSAKIPTSCQMHTAGLASFGGFGADGEMGPVITEGHRKWAMDNGCRLEQTKNTVPDNQITTPGGRPTNVLMVIYSFAGRLSVCLRV